MKKYFTVFLVLLAAFCGLFAFAACEPATLDDQGQTSGPQEEQQPHVHDWDEGVVTLEPTCSREGIRTFACSGCTETKTEPIPADPQKHSLQKHAAVKASCTENGNSDYWECELCGKFFSDEGKTPIERDEWIVEATGHSWDGGRVTQEPTCTEEGVKTFTCNRCEKTRTESVSINKDAHDWDDGDITQAPTCTEEGVKTFTCNRCQKTRTESVSIDEDAHDWDDGNVTLKATCSQEGLVTYQCRRDPKHTKTDVISADPDGHSLQKHAAVKESCTQSGNSDYWECELCGKFFSDEGKTTIERGEWVVEATGHSWDDGNVTQEPTCSQAGVKTFTCNNCQDTRTDPIPIEQNAHEWDDGRITLAATCTQPGTKTYYCRHNGDHVRTEQIEIDLTAHSLQLHPAKEVSCTEDGNSDYWECLHCGRFFSDGSGEQPAEFGEWVLSATGHDYGDADNFTVEREATCIAPGSKYHDCTKCGHREHIVIEVDSTAHNFEEYEAVKAECEKAGNHAYSQCTYCMKYFMDGEEVREGDWVINATGHVETRWETTLTPTCSAPGSKREVCQLCEKVLKTEEIGIDADAHKWDNKWETVLAATCIEQGEEICHCEYDPEHINRKTIDIDQDNHDWSGRTSNHDGTHARVCTRCEKHDDSVPCNFDEHETKDATCTEAGYIKDICTYCEYEKVQTIQALGHRYPDDWTSDMQGQHFKICLNAPTDETHRKVENCADSFGAADVHMPTCMENGYTTRTCEKCNYVLFEEGGEKLGHDFVNGSVEKSTDRLHHVVHCKNDPNHISVEECTHSSIKTDATCTTDGYTTYTCERCSDSYTGDHVDAFGHTYPAKYIYDAEKGNVHYRLCETCEDRDEQDCIFADHTVPATCTKAGSVTATCTVCEHSYLKETLPEIPHLWGSYLSDNEGHHAATCLYGCNTRDVRDCTFDNGTVTAPTCTAKGYTTFTCTVESCSYTKRERETDMIAHDFDSWKPVEAEPGTHSHRCNSCSIVIAQNCNYGDPDVTKPTCTTAGYTTHTCLDCQYSYKDAETLANGHTYPTEWTPAEDYAEGKTGHYRLCSVCGEGRQEGSCETFSYEITDPTCYKAGVSRQICDLCKGATEQEISMIEHTLSGYLITPTGHYRECTVEECTFREEEKSHNMVDKTSHPTCTAAGKVSSICDVCGHVENGDDLPSLGHSYDGKWVYDAQRSQHYQTCSVCNDKDYENCVLDEHVTSPTCALAAVETKTCTLCGNEASRRTIGEPLGCDYGEPVPDGDHRAHTQTCRRGDACDAPDGKIKRTECSYTGVKTAATCTSGGFTTFTCPECHDEYTGEEIPQLGHSWGNWISGRNGTHYHICNNDKGHIASERCSYEQKVVEATCTSGGYTRNTCKHCRYYYDNNKTEKKEHTFPESWQSNENGQHSRTCTSCRTTVTEQCSYETTVLSDNCTTEHIRKTCTYCKYTSETVRQKENSAHRWTLKEMSKDKKQHLMICTVCSEEEYQLCGYDEVHVEATCTGGGKHIHTCSVCKYVYEDSFTDPLGHHYGQYTFDFETATHSAVCIRRGCEETISGPCSGNVKRIVPATCQAGGYTEYVCNTCGGEYTGDPTLASGHQWARSYESIGDKQHRRLCTVCGAADIRSCEFKYETTPATCTANGRSVGICLTCTAYDIQVLPMLGHDFGEHGEDGWKPMENKAGWHSRTCRRADCSETESRPCELLDLSVAATCTSGGKTGKICMDCGYSVGVGETSQLMHDWSDWAPSESGKTHSHYCRRTGCGVSETQPCSLNRAITDQTCESPKSERTWCETCGYDHSEIEAPALGHLWEVTDRTETHHDSYCKRCEATSKAPHDFSESNICSVCETDGLIYEAIAGGTAYMVKSDENVLNAKHIIIPETYNTFPVREIGKFAFYNNTSVESVELPRGLLTIGDSAFGNCRSLTSVSFASGESEIALTTIRYSAFGFTALESFPFGETNKLSTIEASGFMHSRLDFRPEDIPDSLVVIGANAFVNTVHYDTPSHWTNGIALYIGKHLIKVKPEYSGEFTVAAETISIGNSAFEGCTGISSLTIPNTVVSVGNDAFKNCSPIRDLHYQGALRDWLSIVFGNDYSSPLSIVENFHIEKALDNPEFPAEVTAIPAGTFRDNDDLVTVHIPENITSIGAYAFKDCTNLANIVIPDTVTYIGEGAFDGTAFYNTAENWTEGGLLYIDNHLIAANNEKIGTAGGRINVKQGTVTISPKTFMNCTELTYVFIPREMYWIGEQAFTGCTKLKAAHFEGAVNDRQTGVQYFCTTYANGGMGMGRWHDDVLANDGQAAGMLTTFYQGYWRRTRAGTL